MVLGSEAKLILLIRQTNCERKTQNLRWHHIPIHIPYPNFHDLHSDMINWLFHFGMPDILCLQRLSRLNVYSKIFDLTAITVEVGLLVKE